MEWAVAVVAAIFAAGGAWAAVHIELRYLRRDVDRLAKSVGRAHARVDELKMVLFQKG
jgi:hypothetical protein